MCVVLNIADSTCLARQVRLDDRLGLSGCPPAKFILEIPTGYRILKSWTLRDGDLYLNFRHFAWAPVDQEDYGKSETDDWQRPEIVIRPFEFGPAVLERSTKTPPPAEGIKPDEH